MAVVKSINVALRANTENFEAGMQRGAAATKALDASADKIAKRMGEAAKLFQAGVITVEEYSQTLKDLDKDIEAVNAGFKDSSAAMERGAQIMRSLESETESYERQVKELDTLLKAGGLTAEQYNIAFGRIRANYEKTIPVAEAVQAKQTALQKAFSSIVPVVDVSTLAIKAFELAMRGARAVADALRSAISAVSSKMEEIDVARKAAGSIGIATGELLKLRFAMSEVAGTGAAEVDDMLRQMIRRISEASTTGKGATPAIEALGLSVERLASASASDAFFAIVDAMNGIEGSGQRAAYAMQLFGKQGLRLLPTFMANADALRDSAEFAERIGLGISEIDASAIEQANDALNRLSTVLDGISTQITARLGKQVLAFGIGLLDILDKAEGQIKFLARAFDALGFAISGAIDFGANQLLGVPTNAIRAGRALAGGGTASFAEWWQKNLDEANKRLAQTPELSRSIVEQQQSRQAAASQPMAFGSATAIGREQMAQQRLQQQLLVQKKMEAHLARLARQRQIVLAGAGL